MDELDELEVERYPEHIDTVIAAFLSGEANDSEIRELEFWRAASADNQRYFDQLKKIYTSSNEIKEVFNTDVAWKNVHSKMIIVADTPVRQLVPEKKVSDFYKWIQIAAILLVTFSIGWWFYEDNLIKTPIGILAQNTSVQDTLPDGSAFYLRAHSLLSYTKGYGKKERRLKLKGEAYFRVEHQSEVPFIIEAGGVMIKDIGTAFTVNAPPDSNYVEVIVEEGQVFFYRSNGEGINLFKGDHARYSSSTNTLTKMEAVSVNRTAYRTRMLSFENSSLSEVAKMLEEVYQVKVELSPNIRKCSLTADFKNENLETVLDVIGVTLNLNISIEGSLIKMNGQSCMN
ncbi:FecR domain-containing protein [soil metagenome]